MSRSISRPTIREREAESFRNNSEMAINRIERLIYSSANQELGVDSREILREWWGIRRKLLIEPGSETVYEAADRFQVENGDKLESDELLRNGVGFISAMFAIGSGRKG